jgi:hypothetical protein
MTADAWTSSGPQPLNPSIEGVRCAMFLTTLSADSDHIVCIQ